MPSLGGFFQSIIDSLAETMDRLVGLFPDSPFQGIQQLSIDNELFGFINWLIPVDAMVTVMTAWVGAIALYYAWSVIARWVKLISG